MNETKKPQAGEFWRHIRSKQISHVCGFGFDGDVICEANYDGVVTLEADSKEEFLLNFEHLPWCTSFDDVEPVAETAKTIEVNPGEGYRWLEDNEIVQSTDEVFRPDLTPCWVSPLTLAGKAVKQFDPDDYPVRRKLKPPATKADPQPITTSPFGDAMSEPDTAQIQFMVPRRILDGGDWPIRACLAGGVVEDSATWIPVVIDRFGNASVRKAVQG